jgi:hypothetical protein
MAQKEVTNTEQTVKCPICGDPYKVYNMTTADQSACPQCIAKAARKQGTWSNSSPRAASDGTVFPSGRERKRYEELVILQRIGAIRDLKTQTLFILIPRQMNGKKCIERPVTYKCDFDYFDLEGKRHIEDSKGAKTQQYVIRRKLMLWVHGIRIEEV